MFSVSRDFVNEDGETIEVNLNVGTTRVTTSTTSQNGYVENDWTLAEANVMRDLLNIAHVHSASLTT
jgi:hypothetical protein